MAVSISSQTSHASSTTPTTLRIDSVICRPSVVESARRMIDEFQTRATSSTNAIQMMTRTSAMPKRAKRWI
ncbi:hypothetical protein D3C87_1459850 [compost metagenome]